MLGLIGDGEDTEPELVPLGPNWVVPGRPAAEPWDDPAQEEQTTARIPTAAVSVPLLTVIAPARYGYVATCHALTRVDAPPVPKDGHVIVGRRRCITETGLTARAVAGNSSGRCRRVWGVDEHGDRDGRGEEGEHAPHHCHVEAVDRGGHGRGGRVGHEVVSGNGSGDSGCSSRPAAAGEPDTRPFGDRGSGTRFRQCCSRKPARPNETRLVGEHDELGAVSGRRAWTWRGRRGCGGGRAQVQLSGDFVVGQPASDQGEDLAFAIGERVEVAAGPGMLGSARRTRRAGGG